MCLVAQAAGLWSIGLIAGKMRKLYRHRFFARALLAAVLLAAVSGFVRADPPVDINTAGVEELITLPGIGPGLAQRIIADREANGHFREPEEITRVFGIGDTRYQTIKDLITLSRGAAPVKRDAPPVDRINLNTATQMELENLPGIGPVLARRIIEYREQEGGFKKTEDLTLIYGIGAKTYESLKNRVTVYGEALENVVSPGLTQPPPSGPRDLKCWRCGHTFRVEGDVTSGICPSCGAPWRAR